MAAAVCSSRSSKSSSAVPSRRALSVSYPAYTVAIFCASSGMSRPTSATAAAYGLRADQRRLGPLDFAGEIAHVVGAGLKAGPVGGLRDDRELGVEQLPSGVADDTRPEVRQLAAGRSVERHRLHRRGAHIPVVERAQPGTHLTGGPRRERHREHLSRRDMPGRHKVGDAAGDGAGLTGACAGQHAHRPARGEDGLALFVVEVVDDARARDLHRHADHLVRVGRQNRGTTSGMFDPSATLTSL